MFRELFRITRSLTAKLSEMTKKTFRQEGKFMKSVGIEIIVTSGDTKTCKPGAQCPAEAQEKKVSGVCLSQTNRGFREKIGAKLSKAI